MKVMHSIVEAVQVWRNLLRAQMQSCTGKLTCNVESLQKHAANFELSLRQREQDNPRFAFLHPGHQHHWFYR